MDSGSRKSCDGDLAPVERRVYLYPFSRDEAGYQELVEKVIRYRVVLGQPDQVMSEEPIVANG